VGYCGVLGPAECVPTDLLPGSKVYTWPNPNGSRIVLVFKRIVGLKNTKWVELTLQHEGQSLRSRILRGFTREDN